MKLPVIDKPLFDLEIPSQKKTIKSRPFVVKEEKILLTAQQEGEDKAIIQAIKQVLTNCIQDEDFDVDKLATYDLEYMFLKLRARSVNNIIEVSYRDNEDDKVYDIEIDLDKVEMLQRGKEDANVIKINDAVGIIMKHPTVTILDNAPKDPTTAELVDYLVVACVDSIYDEDSVYPASDVSKEELLEFLDSLDVETFNKVREFFDSLPQMYHKIEYTNSKGNVREIELTTLSDFFTWG